MTRITHIIKEKEINETTYIMNKLHKRTLMIVDDDEDDIYFFLKALQRTDESFLCMIEESGVSALVKLRNTTVKPDYIFLDLNMPGMSGSQVLTELKKDETLKNIPAIIYSTSTSLTDKETLLGLGASYFLSKPADVHNLPNEITGAIASVQSLN